MMPAQQFQLFAVRPYCNDRVLNRDIYLTEQLTSWESRLFLLENGELALGNYVHYDVGDPPEEKSKRIGRGFPHYKLDYVKSFDSWGELRKFQIEQTIDLKKLLVEMSYVLVNRDPSTGEYSFYQGAEIEMLFGFLGAL
jgi:hypothetical protein